MTDKLTEINRKITTARLDANTDDAKLKLDNFALTLRRIGTITTRPKVTLDGVERADIQADSLLLKLEALSHVRATPTVSGSGSGGGGSSSLLSKLGSHAPGLGTLAIGAAIPAIGPLLGLGAAGAASLLTPFTAAGIGIGSFAVAAHSSITKLQTDTKTLTADQAAYNAATSDKTRAAAQAKEVKFWASIPHDQQTAITNLHKLSGEWGSFQRSLQPEIFPLIAGGIKLASVGLGYLQPVAKATGLELDRLESSASKAFQQPFWHSFFTTFLPGQATKATGAFATSLGNLVTGGAHLVEAFAPLGGSFESGLVRLTGRFEKWSEGDGPGKFVTWVHKNAPILEHDLGRVAGGTLKLGQALIPLGEKVVHDVGGVAGAIGKFSSAHPGEIKEIGEALLVVGGSLKVIAGADKAITVLTALNRIILGRGIAGAAGVAGGAAGGTAAGDAEAAAGGNILGRALSRYGPGAAATRIGLGGLARTAGVTYFATQGGDVDKAAVSQYQKSIASQQLPSQQTLLSIVTAVDKAVGYKYQTSPSAYLKGAGVATGEHGSQTIGNASTAASFVLANGTPAQIAALKQLGALYPAVQQKLDAYNRSQRLQNNALIDSAPLTASAKSKLDAYRSSLIGAHVPQADLTADVASYSNHLHHVPSNIATHVALSGVTTAGNEISTLLSQLATLKGKENVGAPKTLPSLLTPPTTHHKTKTSGSATSPDTAPSGPTGHGSSRRNTHNPLPTFLTSEGSTSANAPTSSGSGTSASSAKSAAKAAASHALASSNTVASIINYSATTFTSAIEGTEKQVRTGIIDMINRLNTAVRNKYLTGDKTLVDALRKADPALEGLAKRAKKISDALTGAHVVGPGAIAHLATLRGDSASVRSGTKSAYQSLGDISQLTNVSSVAGVLSVEKQQDKVASAFTRNLATLRKKGLSEKEYDELEQAGPGAAGNIVALLATASKRQVTALNSDTDLLTSLGVSTGAASASYLYGPQTAAAKHQVRQLTTEQHRIHTDDRALVKSLDAFVKAGLQDKGTHSRLDALTTAVLESNRLLKQLSGTPAQARTNVRTSPKGHGVNRG